MKVSQLGDADLVVTLSRAELHTLGASPEGLRGDSPDFQKLLRVLLSQGSKSAREKFSRSRLSVHLYTWHSGEVSFYIRSLSAQRVSLWRVADFDALCALRESGLLSAARGSLYADGEAFVLALSDEKTDLSEYALFCGRKSAESLKDRKPLAACGAWLFQKEEIGNAFRSSEGM